MSLGQVMTGIKDKVVEKAGHGNKCKGYTDPYFCMDSGNDCIWCPGNRCMKKKSVKSKCSNLKERFDDLEDYRKERLLEMEFNNPNLKPNKRYSQLQDDKGAAKKKRKPKKSKTPKKSKKPKTPKKSGKSKKDKQHKKGRKSSHKSKKRHRTIRRLR